MLDQRILRRLYRLGRADTASQLRVNAAQFYSPEEFQAAVQRLVSQNLITVMPANRIDSRRVDLTEAGKALAGELSAQAQAKARQELAATVPNREGQPS
jgi:glycerol-3-phosphate O-acyltransferase